MKNYRLIVLMALFSFACKKGNNDPDVLNAQCSYIQQSIVPSREGVVQISATNSEHEVRVLSGSLATELNRRNAFGELNGSIPNLDPCMVGAERLALEMMIADETEMRNAEESLREMRSDSSITRMP